MWLFRWFDANCSWIYNNTNIFTWMFIEGEAPFGCWVLKCIVMSIWYFVIILAPLFIVVRGIGYIISSWIGAIPAIFVKDDD